MKNLLLPKKIIDSKNAVGVEKLKIAKPLQIGLYEPEVTVIKKGGYVLLDFGKEICASLRLLVRDSLCDKKVRIVYGESVSEALSSIGEKGATNDHATRDQVFYIPPYSDMTVNQSGFRFVKIECVGDTELHIKNAYAVNSIYEKAYKGKFTCNDKLVNKIFQTAAYTLKLCLQNGMIWDGIKRDRLVWIGDMNPETLGVNCLYGSAPHVENSLDFVRDQSPLPSWMNGFPTYSLWWIVNLRDYYLQNANREYLEKQRDYLKGLLVQISEKIKDNGETDFPFLFIDWPTHYEPNDPDQDKKLDEIAGTHALTVYAVKCAKELLTVLGEDFTICDEMLAKLTKTKYDVRKYKQISGMKIIAGLGDKKDTELIVNGGAKGMSTFMSYFILKGATSFGYEAESIEMMKDYYGAMLSLGATSFWEDFNIDWAENAYRIDRKPVRGKKDVHGDYGAFCYKGFRHSFCHGWSSGVVPFLMNVVAGVEIVEAGCKKIRITPRLGNLTNVKVDYPTPFGILKVEHTKNADGSISTDLSVPNGIEVVK